MNNIKMNEFNERRRKERDDSYSTGTALLEAVVFAAIACTSLALFL